MLSPRYIILKIQRLGGKQCRSRWGGSLLWATSSRRTLFENSAIFVSCTLRVNSETPAKRGFWWNMCNNFSFFTNEKQVLLINKSCLNCSVVWSCLNCRTEFVSIKCWNEQHTLVNFQISVKYRFHYFMIYTKKIQWHCMKRYMLLLCCIVVLRPQ